MRRTDNDDDGAADHDDVAPDDNDDDDDGAADDDDGAADDDGAGVLSEPDEPVQSDERGGELRPEREVLLSARGPAGIADAGDCDHVLGVGRTAADADVRGDGLLVGMRGQSSVGAGAGAEQRGSVGSGSVREQQHGGGARSAELVAVPVRAGAVHCAIDHDGDHDDGGADHDNSGADHDADNDLHRVGDDERGSEFLFELDEPVRCWWGQL